MEQSWIRALHVAVGGGKQAKARVQQWVIEANLIEAAPRRFAEVGLAAQRSEQSRCEPLLRRRIADLRAHALRIGGV
jgi:hypothetical protein